MIKSDFTSGKEVLDGTYTVDAKINIDEGEQNQGIIVVMEGKFNQTGQSSQSNGTIEVNVQDYSTGTTMLDLLIEGHGDAVVDKNVQVDIPIITPTNSMDLMEIALVGNEITANTAAYPTVILNGSPIIFDVEPDMIRWKTVVGYWFLLEPLLNPLDMRWNGLPLIRLILCTVTKL